VPVAEQEVLLLISDSKDTQQTQSRPQSNTATPNPGAYVASTEANLYTFPTTRAVIVYISRADRTESRETAFACPCCNCGLARAHRATVVCRRSVPGNVWIHLFARVQNQYLFPAGNDVLSDAGLVKWWKAVMDDFMSACTKDEKDSSGGQSRVEPHVILPGATDDEVMHLLRDLYRSQKRRRGMIVDMVTPIHLHHLLPPFPLQDFHFSADVHLDLFWNSSCTYWKT